MKQRIALFKHIEFGYETSCSEHMEDSDKYVRISEYVNVEFPELSGDDQIAGQVRKLDELRDKEVAEHVQRLAAIDERKSRLLAITHQP